MTAALQIAQLIAYVVLTLAGVIVAYRSNFGWKPLALVTSHGLRGGGGEPDVYYAIIRFEVWNRRKYPVVIRSMYVHFRTLKLLHRTHERVAGWVVFDDNVYYPDETVLAPSAHEQFVIEAPFPKRTVDDLRETLRFRIWYFDPRSKKLRAIKFKDVYQIALPR
jgi:hypothetical protein